MSQKGTVPDQLRNRPFLAHEISAVRKSSLLSQFSHARKRCREIFTYVKIIFALAISAYAKTLSRDFRCAEISLRLTIYTTTCIIKQV